jgi:type 2 lantibiotic biosynthesis protein LanM
VTTSLDVSNFDAALGCLFAPALGELATQLAQVAELSCSEQACIVAASRDALSAVLHAKLTRMLVLELNAARVTGRLQAEDPRARFREFLELSATPEFWQEQAVNYPDMPAQVERIVQARCAASLSFGRRLAADRSALHRLPGGVGGALVGVRFGAGDSHRGGLTVALLEFEQGACVYKPRSMAIDTALADFIQALRDHGLDLDSVRVPQVIEREGYGWAEWVSHRYAADESELVSFYRGLGQWLALMRLLAGSDLHSENLIACGGQPVVVDCETLFTPRVTASPSGLGEALDAAAAVVAGSVLNIGLLPGRGMGLGWRGIDNSGAGMLPGQQPQSSQPDIVGLGTDEAHYGTRMAEIEPSQNHPSAEPALARLWPQVMRGFDALSLQLRSLDARELLQPELARFADCSVRVVPRATEVYAELSRMLWHPVSLHKPAPARERAFGLLKRMGGNVATAPDRDDVISAEIDDLLVGDVPFFTTTPARGQLDGPGGTRWLEPRDLAAESLQHWRDADLAFERGTVRAALVSAYINDGWLPDEVSLLPQTVFAERLDERRQEQARRIVERLQADALKGADGSISWIAPVLGPAGWAVQPLEVDLYGGTSGMAVLFAAYLRESGAGRAPPIQDLERSLQRCLHTLDLAQDRRLKLRAEGAKLRPPPPGAYLGLGSQIWARLLFDAWGLPGAHLERALGLLDEMPAAIAADDLHDLLLGSAGAILPLLRLHQRSGDAKSLQLAEQIGQRLQAAAHFNDDGGAFWPHPQWPAGVGGFVHGSTGIGWALEHLSRYCKDPALQPLVAATARFESGSWDDGLQNWRDLRELEGAPSAAAWCHGSVGIGLASLDLDPQLSSSGSREQVQRAVAATVRQGLGWNHCLCHGDSSAWELLQSAQCLALPGFEDAGDTLLARLLSSLETHGAVCGMARDAFVPGLLPGVGGVAYQLLRAHPRSDLPSLLLPGALPQ